MSPYYENELIVKPNNKISLLPLHLQVIKLILLYDSILQDFIISHIQNSLMKTMIDFQMGFYYQIQRIFHIKIIILIKHMI